MTDIFGVRNIRWQPNVAFMVKEHTVQTDEKQAETTVDIIEPNLSAAAAIERSGAESAVTTDDVRVVGYPKFLFDYTCSLNRVFLSDREVPVSITVNGITGGKLRNDAYPELKTRTLPNEALLQPRLTRDDAVEKARSVLRKYISFHFPTYILISGMPTAEIQQEDLAYALYWLVPDDIGDTSSLVVSIVDSISGEVIEENVQISQASESIIS